MSADVMLFIITETGGLAHSLVTEALIVKAKTCGDKRKWE